MKLTTKFALSSLLCALAMPAAHAASATATVDVSQFTLTDLTTGASTLLSWSGLAGGSLSAFAAPYAGDISTVSSGVNSASYSLSAGDSYRITLPYSYTVSALSAGDLFAFVTLGLTATNGVASIYAPGAPLFAFTGETGSASGVLSVDFIAALSGSGSVFISGKAFAASAAPVPETNASLMALAGMGVIGSVAVRRRQASQRG
jgi:hypothetical protein